jgi:CheY-like chemotaxis protein
MRAGQIVRNLLAFARRGAPDRIVTDLNELARATAELREYHLQQVNIKLTLRCAQQSLPVAVNREEIRQVILNLLLNAENAISGTDAGGGEISVETSKVGGFHLLEVSDTGPGISPELRGRIFEPFFTTKEVGQGTGLGLSISLGIVSSHGGALVLVESTRGARFRLSLPVAMETFAPASASGAPPRALVVADDDAIRKLIVKLLERRGFAVSEAQSKESALMLARELRPVVVVCDAVGREMSGADLYRSIASLNGRPAPRFLFISDGKGGDAAGPDVPVLAKPFTATDFDAALGQAGVTASTLPSS